jgi:hypothetical protein
MSRTQLQGALRSIAMSGCACAIWPNEADGCMPAPGNLVKRTQGGAAQWDAILAKRTRRAPGAAARFGRTNPTGAYAGARQSGQTNPRWCRPVDAILAKRTRCAPVTAARFGRTNPTSACRHPAIWPNEPKVVRPGGRHFGRTNPRRSGCCGTIWPNEPDGCMPGNLAKRTQGGAAQWTPFLTERTKPNPKRCGLSGRHFGQTNPTPSGRPRGTIWPNEPTVASPSGCHF